MNVIDGGAAQNNGLSSLMSENGELREVLDALSPRIRLLTSDLMDLGLDLKRAMELNNNARSSRYQIVQSESIATDFGVIIESNLGHQLALLRGQDVAKIHLSIFDAMLETSSLVNKDIPTDEVRRMTLAWEIGRCAGNLLHRAVTTRSHPRSIAKIGMIGFFEKIVNEIRGGNHGAIGSESIPQKSIEQYFSSALPERVASAMGNHLLERHWPEGGEIAYELEETLWQKTMRPLELASEFGADFQPQIDYRDIAAASPLTENELELYISQITA